MLDGNRFGDEGVSILCNAFIYSKINYIDLSENELTEKSLVYLKELCLKNKSINRIDFKKNNIKESIQSKWILAFD